MPRSAIQFAFLAAWRCYIKTMVLRKVYVHDRMLSRRGIGKGEMDRKQALSPPAFYIFWKV